MIDIYSKGEYPANALSNFTANAFQLDEIQCASMEGFLQSLKWRSVKKQKKICLLTGVDAKRSAGRIRNFLWRITQNLYWNGVKYKRESAAYSALITRAFDALYENSSFKEALDSTGAEPLCHSIGEHNKKKTVLTEEEFIEQLYRLRKKDNRLING